MTVEETKVYLAGLVTSLKTEQGVMDDLIAGGKLGSDNVAAMNDARTSLGYVIKAVSEMEIIR